MKKIEWFVEDSNLGGSRGLSVDLENKKIIYHTGIQEKICEHNLDDIRWVIVNNVDALEQKKQRLKFRLNQTKVIKEPIKDGYKILEVLTETQRDIFQNKLNNIEAEIMFFSNLNFNKLLK
jgi:hypothetical protein